MGLLVDPDLGISSLELGNLRIVSDLLGGVRLSRPTRAHVRQHLGGNGM